MSGAAAGILAAMRAWLHGDAGEFAVLAEPLLAADPVRHTLTAGVLAGIRHGAFEPAALLTVHDAASRVAGVALRTADRPVLVSALPAECAGAAAVVLRSLGPIPGATGPTPEVDAFAAAVRKLGGGPARTVLRLRLFALDELRPPRGVPGAARAADGPDLELLADWRLAFELEAVGRESPEAGTPHDRVGQAVAAGTTHLLWEVDGTPVSMAAVSAPAAGTSRVAPVYTPPERRGRGYGSAVTAAATGWALTAGARHVVLFTDLANPVSNAIYPRIGYRPVHDAVEVAFDPGG